MAYIWSYLRRYPKWLAMNFTAAILFVIANLGLPTVLARMIDEGINRGDADKLYTYAWVMFGVVLTGIVGRVLLSYAVSKLTTTMVQVMRNDIYAKLQEYSHHEYEQIGVSSLVTRITSDAFVLSNLRNRSKDGCHYSSDDGFQCLLDFDDKSIFGLDCGNFLAFPSRSSMVCGGKKRVRFLKSNRQLSTRLTSTLVKI